MTNEQALEAAVQSPCSDLKRPRANVEDFRAGWNACLAHIIATGQLKAESEKVNGN